MATPRPHDADAGGDPGLRAAKAALREEVWDELEAAGAGRFPGTRNRIPNFVGAEDAADRLAGTAAWQRARVVKCNPDSPQRPVRTRALQEGRVVVMAVPRLASDPAFLVLDPDHLDVPAHRASSIRGADEHAVPTDVDDLPPVDLVVQGCVAVDEAGHRLGKGGGFADLEFAIASAAGVLDPDVAVVTTVHDVQVRDEVPVDVHDVVLDLVVTPSRTLEVDRADQRRPRLDAGLLTDAKRASIPLLDRLLDDGHTVRRPPT